MTEQLPAADSDSAEFNLEKFLENARNNPFNQSLVGGTFDNAKDNTVRTIIGKDVRGTDEATIIDENGVEQTYSEAIAAYAAERTTQPPEPLTSLAETTEMSVKDSDKGIS